MSTSRAIAASVLWHLIMVAFYAIDYWFARVIFDANSAWAAGVATSLAVVFIVGVPKWSDYR